MLMLTSVRRPAGLGRPADVLSMPAVGVVERIGRYALGQMGARAQRTAFTPCGGAPLRPHFRRIVEVFFIGYRAALATPSVDTLIARLSRTEPEHRGFAYEGAGMALTALDLVLGSRGRRLKEAVAAAPAHVYLLHVGAGWALAQFRCVERRTFRGLDPVLRWLAIDGAGFHEGYFAPAPGQPRPGIRRRLSAAGARLFDQGIGRSLWFTADANPDRIRAAIAGVESERHADVWSGVGLAAAYAGGADERAIVALRDASGPLVAHFAQGAAFAAEAHLRAGGPAPRHTEQVCRLVCALSAGEAASQTRQAAVGLADEGGLHAYEVWRSRLRLQLSKEVRLRCVEAR
jgi:hypothetical protein